MCNKIQIVKQQLAGIKMLENVELRHYTTFGIGGICELMCVPIDTSEYVRILDVCRLAKINRWILGRGSNILVDSAGIDGIVINTRNLDKIVVQDNTILAECGVALAKVSELAKSNQIGGMEWCAGIPGSVGGAVVGNAGAFGGDMSKIVQKVTIWQDGIVKSVENEKILFNYRKSVFKNDTTCAIIGVDMLGHREASEKIQDKMRQNMEYRMATQNVRYPNAGCIFNNTEIAPAKMIDRSGLKGYRVGDAMISTEHANFVVNVGKASSDDVLELIKIIKEKIYRDWGKRLDVEIVYWGRGNV
ncbi:MAG: UDP-N-acetylmuramate dehydrogenase [Clostridia bacterium]|nr:UDP-N-acetylmuramate dehydrogenase [Clostridia bacterium]